MNGWIIFAIISIVVMVVLYIGYRILKSVSPDIFDIFEDPAAENIPHDDEQRHKD